MRPHEPSIEIPLDPTTINHPHSYSFLTSRTSQFCVFHCQSLAASQEPSSQVPGHRPGAFFQALASAWRGFRLSYELLVPAEGADRVLRCFLRVCAAWRNHRFSWQLRIEAGLHVRETKVRFARLLIGTAFGGFATQMLPSAKQC